ncbi:MAG: 50S ribosomal protein L11 methyltransferase [Acidobacteriota bacterium]|nr:50S ribosomal protein L11 methyltransferase [Acidobacteriota bacterium]
MPRQWPVLVLRFPAAAGPALRDRVIAALDDWQPTALDEADSEWRAYFIDAAPRDRAADALSAAFGPDGLQVTRVDEPDEDWARRSQADLKPIHVGRILVLPTSSDVPRPTSDVHSPRPTSDVPRPAPPIPKPESPIPIVIEPSMGFGTGHHATTRLCLAALQQLDLAGAAVLDVGCGSGILAIAADRLGAARVTGLDNDPDAVESARRNLALNPAALHTTFALTDIRAWPPAGAQALLANLTGGFLASHADALLRHLATGGTCILSGILADEEDAVLAAFSDLTLVARTQADEWVGLVLRRGTRT